MNRIKLLLAITQIFIFCATSYAVTCGDLKPLIEKHKKDDMFFILLDTNNSIPDAKNYVPKNIYKERKKYKDIELTEDQANKLEEAFYKKLEQRPNNNTHMHIEIDGLDIILRMKLNEPYKYPSKETTEMVACGLRSEAEEKFKQMAEAAANERVKLRVVSAYRSYEMQTRLYRGDTQRQHGMPENIAAPGHSQHQLGLAVDINTTNSNGGFERTPEFQWLTKNAGKYGFSLSFPKGAEHITGYIFEPWHWRYITPRGVEMQNKFFGDDIAPQHAMLFFIKACLEQEKQKQQEATNEQIRNILKNSLEQLKR
jgi:hypothetical protein